MNPDVITIKGIRVHNIKNLDVVIPKNKITVITGVSGSGKSSLAFDTLFAEGQRRYIESLSHYSRQFMSQTPKPLIDSISGLSPTISVEQKTGLTHVRSTVGTVTELHDYLRLLFARLSHPICPVCQEKIVLQTPDQILKILLDEYKNKMISLYAPLVYEQKGLHQELLYRCQTLGIQVIRVNGKDMPIQSLLKENAFLKKNQKNSLSARVTRIKIEESDIDQPDRIKNAIQFALKIGKGAFFVLHENKETLFSTRFSCPNQHPGLFSPQPATFSFNSKMGACELCEGTGMEEERICTSCEGNRLKKTSLCFLIAGHPISDLTKMTLEKLSVFLSQLSFKKSQAAIADRICIDIQQRIGLLKEIGLGYLSLDRACKTLSGGELQRLRLATQVGSNLIGATYVLDEPSIGLHPCDNDKLITALKKLRDQGNTLVIVEHDEEMILNADYVIDLGPGAGTHGGQIMAEGNVQSILSSSQSLTAKYLKKQIPIGVSKSLRPKHFFSLEMEKVQTNNLKNITVHFPLGFLSCVTGVSGSGKSSLIMDTLYPAANAYLQKKPVSLEAQVKGLTHIDKVIQIDQAAVGSTSRSNPATYIGVFDLIRKFYASLPEAKLRGYTPDYFSFNKKTGTCSYCNGLGLEIIKMQFLADTSRTCPHCLGNRYNPETLHITYRGKNIKQTLDMTISDAIEFFEAHYLIRHGLEIAHEIGLGYLQLGQSLGTLSGGECQRLKITEQLSKKTTGSTLYILDEPSTGLHFYDVSLLLKSLEKLVEQGNTVIVIEHHLDIIKQADHVIDLGPGAGEQGGQLIAQGSVEQIMKNTKSLTAKALRQSLGASA